MSDVTDVIIIGAGMGGLIAAIDVKESGRSFLMLERADSVGGVWRENVYPGCACDVPSHLYSIAARPNPDWSSVYATQPEILAYMQTIARRDGLEDQIRFNTTVTGMAFDEKAAHWIVSVAAGEPLRARFVILATGPQSHPVLPDLPGLGSFQGGVMHSARWDRSADLSGKRVGVIGTGASAVQIVPALVGTAAHISLFQRSAPWVLPRWDRRTYAFERAMFRAAPWLQRAVRGGQFWYRELFGLGYLGWSWIHRLLDRIGRLKLAREVRTPALRETMTPDYQIGCKRALITDTFYPALNDDSVSVIADPIQSVDATGLITDDGRHHAFDWLVFATGFGVADALGIFPITGVGGAVIPDVWKSTGPRSYVGCTVSGFPNLGMLLGPNSGLGHSSALHVMESQMAYLRGFLDALDNGGALMPDPDAEAAWNDAVQDGLRGTVWASGCQSWYINARTGRNTTIYPGLSSTYRRALRRFDIENYRAV